MIPFIYLPSNPLVLQIINHALAYECFDYNNYPCIPGTEIATSYKGEIIEILGYGIEPTVINEWYRDFYSRDNLEHIEITLFKRIQECAKNKIISLMNHFN